MGICPVWVVFAVRMKKPWVLSYTLSTQWRLWSDCEDVQADLSLCWARLEPDRSATEESYSLEILDSIYSNKRPGGIAILSPKIAYFG